MSTSRLVSAFRVMLAAGVLALGGCASSYIVPGKRADFQAFTPAPGQADSFAAKPTAPFPATLAFVRVQSPDYGRGRDAPAAASLNRYSVITTREVEEDAQIERLGHLPQIAGVTGLSRMLLPSDLQGDKQLRDVAARLQADLVLVYTFDTEFFEADMSVPLTVVTLGFSPTRKVSVSTTVSALLMDTRTGYIYSTYESTKKDVTHATSWGSNEAANETRRDNEREAFRQLVDEVGKSWPKLLDRYAHKS